MQNRSNVPPLARSHSKDVLDWDHLEPPAPQAPAVKDPLGLSAADRAALGLSAAPRAYDAPPQVVGDAKSALADVLARGGAMMKSEKSRK